MAKKFRFKLYIFLILLVFYAVWVYSSSTAILLNKGEADFESKMSSAVYRSLGNELMKNANFSDYFKINYDKDGCVAFISTDSYRVNLLAHSLADYTFASFSEMCEKGVEIPIGAFFGVRFFSGFGKSVPIKLINVTSVKCDFVSKFESVGINQTRQSLYLEVTPDVVIFSGHRKISKQSKISVLVYDNLIVGKVPTSYLNAQIIGSSQ